MPVFFGAAASAERVNCEQEIQLALSARCSLLPIESKVGHKKKDRAISDPASLPTIECALLYFPEPPTENRQTNQTATKKKEAGGFGNR
jgi:hypothetical protein